MRREVTSASVTVASDVEAPAAVTNAAAGAPVAGVADTEAGNANPEPDLLLASCSALSCVLSTADAAFIRSICCLRLKISLLRISASRVA